MATAADHPRIRGEHQVASEAFFEDEGSSPHTRGARGRARVYPISSRIIPAYAGSTPHCSRETGTSRDHPRIRGEHGYSELATLWEVGSSPHTRGAPLDLHLARDVEGIIPAYAGSTHPPCGKYSAGTDHPRIRGEHSELSCHGGLTSGSSPHTRGAPNGCDILLFRTGIIPAYAGSTREPGLPGRRQRDHPRIRGEHVCAFLALVLMLGSSPHTRGALSRAWPRRRPGGIIPAYAGSTARAG